MPDLVVNPIDLSKRGSYRERKAFLRLLKRFRDAQKQQDPDAALDIFDEADALIVKRLKTSDGSPVETLLDDISANQFDQLLSAIAFEGGLGEAKNAPSANGQAGAGEIIPIG